MLESLLVMGYGLLVIGYWLLVIGYWLLVMDDSKNQRRTRLIFAADFIPVVYQKPEYLREYDGNPVYRRYRWLRLV